eukprot:TRINITY_DN653_c2_g1_i1.p1 TRINITY_DN653_c2_g1~~TRINITY_DN653_c2_g1_i1.p1  ORF type:complete len:250 (-),score=34.20 TRINITY_DN653_c2_g1_i1:94-843(-)
MKINSIGTSSKYVSNMIEFNTTLRCLNLSNNQLCNQGAILISNAIKSSNNSITSLNLGGNYISLVGLVSLSDLLRTNTKLKILNISRNDFLVNCRELYESLKINTTLIKLDIRENDIAYNGDSFVKILKTNTTLTELDIYEDSKIFKYRDIQTSIRKMTQKNILYLHLNKGWKIIFSKLDNEEKHNFVVVNCLFKYMNVNLGSEDNQIASSPSSSSSIYDNEDVMSEIFKYYTINANKVSIELDFNSSL